MRGQLKHCVPVLSTDQFILIGGQVQISGEPELREIRMRAVVRIIAASKNLTEISGTCNSDLQGELRSVGVDQAKQRPYLK